MPLFSFEADIGLRCGNITQPERNGYAQVDRVGILFERTEAMVARDRVEPSGEAGISAETMPVPVSFKEYFLREIERPAAVARKAEAPGIDADSVAVEQFSEKTIAVSDIGITKYKHQFLIRECLRRVLSHTIEFAVNAGLSWHARIIVAGRFSCRQGLVKTL